MPDGVVMIAEVDLPVAESVVTGSTWSDALGRAVRVEVQFELDTVVAAMANPVASLSAAGRASTPEQPRSDTSLVLGLGGARQIRAEREKSGRGGGPGSRWNVAVANRGVG